MGALPASAGGPGSAAGSGQRSMQLLLHFPAADGPVRALAWAPAQLAGATSDSAHRHLVAAVGHTTYLRLWDLRQAPLLLPCLRCSSWQQTHPQTRSTTAALLMCSCRIQVDGERACCIGHSDDCPDAGASTWQTLSTRLVRGGLCQHDQSELPCRDSFRPALQVDLPQRWRFSVQWLHDPAGLLTAEDCGALRWTSLDPFFRRERMPANSLFECAPRQPHRHCSACRALSAAPWRIASSMYTRFVGGTRASLSAPSHAVESCSGYDAARAALGVRGHSVLL